MAFARGLLRSPFHSFSILYFCASLGLGTNLTTISNSVSCSGTFFDSSATPSFPLLYASMTSANVIFFCWAMGIVKPHLSLADPKATVPSAGLSFHLLLNCGSAYRSIKLFTSLMTSTNLCCICWGVYLSSLISLSTLFMKRSGLTLSSRDWRITVSV